MEYYALILWNGNDGEQIAWTEVDPMCDGGSVEDILEERVFNAVDYGYIKDILPLDYSWVKIRKGALKYCKIGVYL